MTGLAKLFVEFFLLIAFRFCHLRSSDVSPWKARFFFRLTTKSKVNYKLIRTIKKIGTRFRKCLPHRRVDLCWFKYETLSYKKKMQKKCLSDVTKLAKLVMKNILIFLLIAFRSIHCYEINPRSWRM